MINATTKLSDNGIQLLKAIEAFRGQPYDDQTGQPITAWCKGATIGYGHLITRKQWQRFKDGITEPVAAMLLADALISREAAVYHAISKRLTQQQFDALVLLAYNIGNGAFARSSVVKMINNPRRATRYPTLETAWKAWNLSQGRVNPGLINRRRCEWDVWQHGIYKAW